MNSRILWPLPAVFMLLGCGSVDHYSYQDSHLALPSAVSTKSAAVVVLDQRYYVLSGHKDENFVGVSRGGLAIPQDVSTRSRTPMAAEMSQVVAQALVASGQPAKAIVVPSAAGRDGARTALQASGAERQLLFSCREWHTDNKSDTLLEFDLTLEVFDAAGTQLALKHDSGVAMGPMSNNLDAEDYAQKWFAEKFGGLLAEPAIASVLR